VKRCSGSGSVESIILVLAFTFFILVALAVVLGR
jgi:hypothetical protein